MEEPVPAAYVEQGAACMDSSLQPLNPNRKSQSAPPSCLDCHLLPGKVTVKKSQPDSKGNSCRVENAAQFTPSCRMKGIPPSKWQELFPGWAPSSEGWFDHGYPKNRHGSHGRKLTHPGVTDTWKSWGVCEGVTRVGVTERFTNVTKSQRDKEEQRSWLQPYGSSQLSFKVNISVMRGDFWPEVQRYHLFRSTQKK